MSQRLEPGGSLPSIDRLQVERLDGTPFPSPLDRPGRRWVGEDERVLLACTTTELDSDGATPPSFEMAGPRPRLAFDPAQTRCALVTCGGLCPGLNDVVRSITLTLRHGYGVDEVRGYRYGYSGLAPGRPAEPIDLTPELVESLHERGGTILGSSRGARDVAEMVDTLVAEGIDVLFTIGGDGTLAGAQALATEIARRSLRIAVVGVPKTIDNDIAWIERSFGFATAVEEASQAILAAHAEARGAWNGIGLVKLMGRHSGFIAAHASLASSDVNFCLVPEVPFELDGPKGLLAALERRLDERHHAVVVVAEGAAQELMQTSGSAGTDPSGNVRLGDVGPFLKKAIVQHFAGRGTDVTLKYIDPSYIIRSLPANSIDSEYCQILGQHAVHAAMAGRTNLLVGYWNRHFTHVPISLVAGRRKQLDPQGEIWPRVLGSTGQPPSMVSSA